MDENQFDGIAHPAASGLERFGVGEIMDGNRPNRRLAGLIGRRGAIVAIGGLALLTGAGLGGSGREAEPSRAPGVWAKTKRRKKRGGPSAGAPGPSGPAGPMGPAGASGVSGYEVVQGPIQGPDEGYLKVASAACPGGKRVLGGGYRVGAGGSNAAEITVFISQFQGEGWVAAATEDDDGNVGEWSLRAYAICAEVE